MFDEKHVYEAIMAETYLKGEANGIEKGIEQGIEQGIEKGAQQEREKNEALDTKRVEYLRSQNIPDDVISAMLALK